MKTMRNAPPNAPAASGDLSRLLETERRLEAQLAAARAEAEALLAAARREAAQLETGQRAGLDRALAALEKELREERERRLAGIEAESRGEVARWDGMGDGEVARLAGMVVRRVISGAGTR
jgi:F0F1-type ATP synthase membrane subunit b/b'